MFGRLMPFEGRFFELFNALADEIVEAGRELAAMMEKFDDLERRAYEIETIEKRGDRITREAIELLHKTFITPLDRDEIHQLVTRMDDILDLMSAGSAHRRAARRRSSSPPSSVSRCRRRTPSPGRSSGLARYGSSRPCAGASRDASSGRGSSPSRARD